MTGKFIVVWLACTWLIFSGLSAKTFFFPSIKNVALQVMNYFVGTAILFSCVMYGLAYYKLKKLSKNFVLGSISSREKQARVMKEKPFLRTIILIACIQIACVVPTTLLLNHHTHFQALLTDGPFARILRLSFGILFYLNFAVNPVVYVLRLPNYRKTFHSLFCCKAVLHPNRNVR